MKRTIGLLLGGLLLLGHAGTADAAAAKPKGKYAFTTVDSCEAKFTFTFKSYVTAAGPTDNAVRTINSVANGHIGVGVGYITFTPTSASGGTFTMSLTDIGGGALRINNGGVDVTTKPQSFTGNYSFTATTFTLTPSVGNALTFTMAYGEPDPTTNITKSVHLIRQDSSGETANCVMAITATK
jgi:hypothetical protein